MFNFVKHFSRNNVRKFGLNSLYQYSTETFQGNIIRKECTQNIPQTFGQPFAMTHPHLLKDGEVTPGICLDEYKDRRRKLAKRILSNGYEKNSDVSHIAIIPSSCKVYMSDNIPYVFRQNTDFLYLTGCQEPDCALVIAAKAEKYTSCLFMRPKDDHAELWDGPRTGTENAIKIFGVDQALPVAELESFLTSLLNQHKQTTVWYDNSNTQTNLHQKLHHLIKQSETKACVSLKQLIHHLRLIKSQSEIKLMQKSCEIASKAIKKTIQISSPGISEHQLFATVDYECRMNGAEFLAYPPVIASGNNANIIHYISNNQITQDGDMVLMDAGCEYHGYASDITRTWPVNGTFSKEQKILYEVVLDVQKELIRSLTEMPTLDKVFNNMCYLLGKRLQEIGLIPKDFTDKKLLAAAYIYCPHHVSHYLGMDVHDTAKIPRMINVQPGMVVTVEPGIYINHKNQLAPPEFHGIGIRIEDDVLIKESGPVVLSRSCPKEIIEIETLMKQNQI